MEISKIKLTDIEPADYNPRTISESARKKLRNSIETFGLIDPIIINLKTNRIIGGHQRYNVLLDMVMESDNLAEKEFDFLKKDDYGFIFDSEKLVIENEDYEKALNIVLNNTNLTGDYDYPKLESLLSDLEFNGFDLEFTGFDNADFEEMEFDFRTGGDVAPVDVVEDDFTVDDELGTDIQRGDLFKLGNHHLLCGDSTLAEDVEKLMTINNERERAMAKILFTSPPYSDMRDYHEGAENITPTQLKEFIKTYKPYTDYQVINLGLQQKDYEVHPYWNEYLDYAKENGYKFLSWNVWDKNSAGSIGEQHRMFPLRHEWIFVFGTEPYDCNRTVLKKEGSIYKKGDVTTRRQKDGSMKISGRGDTSHPYKKMESVLSLNAELGKIRGDHPATFPIGLPSAYIQAMTNENDNIIDCFGGSGTTLIACEQLNRNCYMMELSPKYCQVIINRWEEYTGNKAEKID